MRLVPNIIAVSLLVSVACGSSSSPAPAPPSEPSPSPEPSGNPTTSTPSTPSPTPDRFVTIERLDGDHECDALVPTNIPAPVTVHVADRGSGCGRGVSEGRGHVAVADGFGPGWIEWQVLSPSGGTEDRMTLHRDILLPQPEGWQGARASALSGPMTVDLLTFFSDGSPRRSETPSTPGLTVREWTLSDDPLGGSLLVEDGVNDAGSPSCVARAFRFDAAGAPRGAPGSVGCLPVVGGVSTTSDALVIENANGRSILQWLRVDGSSARAPADDGGAPPFGIGGPGRLQPLLDGSLARQDGQFWTRRYPHLADHGEAAPAWLAARTGWSFRFTRGNRGYAFFPPAGQASSDCTQVVELLAPSGRRCVRATFREDAKDCTTRPIDQGWDGTVVQQSGKDVCTYRWWPALFAAP